MQSTLSLMINSAPQDQLSFDQELELGTRIQAGLRAKRMARYIELNAKQDRNSDEKEEFEELLKEFENAENLDKKDINFLNYNGVFTWF